MALGSPAVGRRGFCQKRANSKSKLRRFDKARLIMRTYLTEHHYHHHIDFVAHNNSSHLSNPAADRNILDAPSQAYQNPIPRIILNNLAYNLSSSRKPQVASGNPKFLTPNHHMRTHSKLPNPVTSTHTVIINPTPPSPTVTPVKLKTRDRKKLGGAAFPHSLQVGPLLRRSE